MNRRNRSAFTLVELLVVIAIMGILMSMMIPGVQAVREASRQFACKNSLGQLVIAVHNYEMVNESYPTGTIDKQGPILNQPQGYHHNWITVLLPYMEEKNTYNHIDRSVGVYHQNNAPVRGLSISLLRCPSDSGPSLTRSNYAAVYHDTEAPIDVDNDGVFFLNSAATTYDEISDGSTHTIFLGDKVIDRVNPAGDLGWMSGTSATLRNTGIPINITGFLPLRGLTVDEQFDFPGAAIDADEAELGATPDEGQADEPTQPLPPGLPVGGFGSYHAGGANFAFGDGRVQFIGENVASAVYQRLGHRADGQLLDGNSY